MESRPSLHLVQVTLSFWVISSNQWWPACWHFKIEWFLFASDLDLFVIPVGQLGRHTGYDRVMRFATSSIGFVQHSLNDDCYWFEIASCYLCVLSGGD